MAISDQPVFWNSDPIASVWSVYFHPYRSFYQVLDVSIGSCFSRPLRIISRDGYSGILARTRSRAFSCWFRLHALCRSSCGIFMLIQNVCWQLRRRVRLNQGLLSFWSRAKNKLLRHHTYGT